MLLLAISAVAAAAEPVNLKRCPAGEQALPGALAKVLDAVLVVRHGDVSGSAVFVSPDGWALTAAHVVEGVDSAEVALRSGITLAATVVRRDTAADVALLRVAGAGFACLETGPPPALGGELYAIGSPLAAGLEFTVTRGILSGDRAVEGVHLLQTDASVNAGNSGGPLVDAGGHVVAIVSRKLVGEAVEGIAFGVATDTATTALGLAWGDVSSAPESVGAVASVGTPAPVGPAAAWEAAAYTPLPTARARRTPPAGPLAGAAVVATAGWWVVGTTSLAYAASPRIEPAPFRTLQGVNLGGWIAAVGGSAVVAVVAVRR